MTIIATAAPLHTLGASRSAEAAVRTTSSQPVDAAAMESIAAGIAAQAVIALGAFNVMAAMLRTPERGPLSADDAKTVIAGLPGGVLIGPAGVQRQQLMERAATLSETGMRQAVSNGAQAAPESLKAGTEQAMVRQLAAAGTDSQRQGRLNQLLGAVAAGALAPRVPSADELLVLRDSGVLEPRSGMAAELDRMMAMAPEERAEKTRTEAMFAMMVLLMTLLMELGAQDREHSAEAMLKAEAFVKSAGERLVASAVEHRTGAAIALGTTVAIGAAGVGVMGAGAFKNVKSINHNERVAINHNRAADQQALGLAQGQTRVAGGQASAGQQNVLSANGHRTAAAESYAKHGMNTTRNAVMTSGGQSVAQMGGSAANVAQADADTKAAEQQRIKDNLSKSAEVSQKTAESRQQEAAKARESTEETRRQLMALGDAQAATRDAITRNFGA